MHIVLVEDDEVIRETTQISLERFGYTVSAFEDGRDGYEFVASHGADVVLLDLMLPTMNGASICRAIREKSTVPIIIISARSEPIDIVQSLEAGADDYLIKPFDMQVLNARIRAVVRRFITAGNEPMGFSPDEIGPPAEKAGSDVGTTVGLDGIPEVLGPSPGLSNPGSHTAAAESSPASVAAPAAQAAAAGSRTGQATPASGTDAADRGHYRTRLGSLVLDSARLTVLVDDKEVHLTPTELRVLLLLTEEPGHVYSREKIAYTVWGYEWAGDSRVVDVHIQRLRKKIGARMIETVRGFGYRFAG
ncbi:response regulator transcription factor [Brevibacterium sp. UBA7493]|uniref:response regulator transcription factor n=1 Tax=Brevibacterium sp. UBA7493 TaxID=1946121 RepID=UPI0025806A74|nr:response regulator transcription factor [Brevibacterium sp. UBA7493]